MRLAHPAAAAGVLLLALGAGAAAGQTGGGEAGEPPPAPANPCTGPLAAEVRCPDLVMKRPYDLTLDTKTRRGRTLLRAANSIDNVGHGPAELRGRRDGRRTMAAVQRIHRIDGSRLVASTGARLYFKAVPGQGAYWKFRDAARFELWRLGANGVRTSLVRTGPKQIYCLRDLRRTRRLSNSPRERVYPACDQNARTRAVTLGTSVGWSDIYPAGYPEQWIDVTGLRGTFDYVQIADPRNGIHELDEANNSSHVDVRLPFRGSRRVVAEDY